MKKKVELVIAKKVVSPVKTKVVAPRPAKIKKDTLDKMTLAELNARRIEIAEQIITSNVHWEIDKDGNYHSMLDKTDYWKIKEKIEQWK